MMLVFYLLLSGKEVRESGLLRGVQLFVKFIDSNS